MGKRIRDDERIDEVIDDMVALEQKWYGKAQVLFVKQEDVDGLRTEVTFRFVVPMKDKEEER